MLDADTVIISQPSFTSLVSKEDMWPFRNMSDAEIRNVWLVSEKTMDINSKSEG